MRVETREVHIPPDITLRVETYPGSDATLVMLPGAGLGAAALGELPLRLATAGYRVLAVNPRGAA